MAYGIKIVAYYSDDGQGYQRVKLSDGRITRLHRFLMERSLGRRLHPAEVVHHKDGDKSNNCLENLELTTQAAHASIHSPVVHEEELQCAACGQKFKRPLRYIRAKKSQGQKQFFCSRRCSAANTQANNSHKLTHGTFGKYRKGYRCTKCRAANTERHRRYRERKKISSFLGR